MKTDTTPQKRKTLNRQGLYAAASEYSLESIKTLVDLMRNSRNPNVKLGAAKALLDKALPDLKAMELSGDVDRPLGVVILPALKDVTDKYI